VAQASPPVETPGPLSQRLFATVSNYLFPFAPLTLLPFPPVYFGQNLRRLQAHLDQALFRLAE